MRLDCAHNFAPKAQNSTLARRYVCFRSAEPPDNMDFHFISPCGAKLYEVYDTRDGGMPFVNIVFTCGGTGGHIYPAIAVARLFEQRQPGCNILFIGAEDGMENKIVPREGFRLETLKISNFQRKLTPSAIAHNIETAAHLTESRRKVLES